MSGRADRLFLFLSLGILVAYLFFKVCVVGFTNVPKTKATLEMSGFTEIYTTGYRYGSCSRGDSTCTGFTAKNVQGATVKGAVGCGHFFKGCTVRIEP